MKNKLLILACLLSASAFGQLPINTGVIYVSSAPSGACTQQPPVQVLNSSGVIYTCNGGTWAAGSGGGGGDTITSPNSTLSVGGTSTATTLDLALGHANTWTGIQSGPTGTVSTSSTQFATQAFVLGQVGTATPLSDGTPAVGTSFLYARQDHVHPSDTSRAPLASPNFTGTPTAPTQAISTNNTDIATTAAVTSAISAASFSGPIGSVNAQTGTTYTVLSTDVNKLLTFSNASNIAVTLPVATTSGFGSGKSFFFKNVGATWVTITPTTSTVDGFTTLTLAPYETAAITSDGTNYFVWDRKVFWSTGTPTVAVGAGAGTGGSPGAVLAAGSTNASGQVQVTTGSTPGTSNQTIFSLTFANGGFKKAPYCVVSPASIVAANNPPFINGGGSTSALTVLSTGGLAASSLAYYDYQCAE